jgi:hypothetical protein
VGGAHPIALQLGLNFAADLCYMHVFEATFKAETSWEYNPEVLHATIVFSISMGY